SNKTAPVLLQRLLAAEDTRLTTMSMLLGGISVLVGREDGSLTQFFPVRNKDNKPILQKIRDFDTHDMAQIQQIVPEQRRKGFLAIDKEGQLGIFYSTARRTLLVDAVTDKTLPSAFALSPRAEILLVENDQKKLEVWEVHNEHPEVSLSALWLDVWYESYPEPDYIWQSSSASSDFEPKFSLAPLVFGTIKAAFYAMLVAMPLAIFGAIYTAYFMSPGLRSIVKPGVEIMSALPTVILGFLAGLWLAPVIESHLPGVFSMLLIVPLGVMLFTWGLYRLPEKYVLWAHDERAAAILIPVVLLLGWFSLAISYPIEQALFDGDMRIWLNQVGINFDQRNSIIVGVAMGFAVIPVIFSITEDAVFSVPKHLTTGSLALGATPWQTLTRVVILTASPGIFSAVMIGLGRAVGETMIVLMATGNTPVMDFNIFEGMRTLSANIAVEMPESEVGSTHYRILFLAAFVLFVFTFLFNTIAEIVRHRLRERYGNL
ncbi:MAG: ABC transporter permease subunit, partial [Pseudomonadota bacterium]